MQSNHVHKYINISSNKIVLIQYFIWQPSVPVVIRHSVDILSDKSKPKNVLRYNNLSTENATEFSREQLLASK